MEARATAKYIRISPRKVKIVIDLVRGKNLGEALNILNFTPKAASEPVLKLIRSAAANAENNYDMNVENLYVAEIQANQGPTLKRFRPRAQGRATQILKRTSHITFALKERELGGILVGPKVNPHGSRVGVIKDWNARWYAKDKDFPDLLVEDQKIRKYI